MRLSWPKRWQKKTHLSRELLLYSPKDFFISFLLYAASVFVCLILRHFDTSKATSYVAMIFLLDVFLTAFFTDGFLFSLLDAVLGVLSVDYIFTEPYWHISFTLSGVPVTFLVMMTISILTGILTSRAKQLDAVSREAEREKLYAGLLRAVSHDIRTPLTGIVGATNVLLEQEETITPAQRHELLQSANQEAQWLIRIVENLLSITRIGAENACVTKTPEAAEEVIEGAVAKVEACNNGFDAVPTWEDITAMVQINRVYNFTNKTKTASKWGVNIRFTITKNEGFEGEVSISGFGGAYE